MIKEEKNSLVQYILVCVVFHHTFDKSYEITEGAKVKEELMFLKSVDFLKELIEE